MFETASLLNPRLRPRYAKDKELRQATAVLAVPFNSYHRDGTPDASNKTIAEVSQRISADRKLPLYAQPEQLGLIKESQLQTYAFPSKLGDWVKTEELVKWMALQVDPGSKVIVVGHKHHVRRAALLLKQNRLVPLVAEESRSVPYDKKGGQWWCRSAGVYVPWEYAARARLVLLALFGKV